MTVISCIDRIDCWFKVSLPVLLLGVMTFVGQWCPIRDPSSSVTGLQLNDQ